MIQFDYPDTLAPYLSSIPGLPVFVIVHGGAFAFGSANDVCTTYHDYY